MSKEQTDALISVCRSVFTVVVAAALDKSQTDVV